MAAEKEKEKEARRHGYAALLLLAIVSIGRAEYIAQTWQPNKLSHCASHTAVIQYAEK